MSLLLDRRLEIVIADKDGGNARHFSETLNITSFVTKALDTDEPDSCLVAIYNLSRETRNGLSSNGEILTLNAGYPDSVATLFTGDIQKISHSYIGPDWVTTVKAGDASVAHRISALNKTYEKGALLKDMVSDIANAFGVVEEYIGDSEWTNKSLPRGKTLADDTKHSMRQIARANNIQWALQDGKLVLSSVSGARQAAVFLLSSETGLLNSPSIEEVDIAGGSKENEKGFLVSALALCNPALIPGNKVLIRSASLSVLPVGVSAAPSGDLAMVIKRATFNLGSIEGQFSVLIEGEPL